MKVGILVVPFLTCERHVISACHALQSVQYLFWEGEKVVLAVENRCDRESWKEQILPFVDSYKENERNNLSLAWNFGAKQLFAQGCKYVLIINLDVVLHPLLLETLVALACVRPDAILYSGFDVQSPEKLLEETENKLLEPHSDFSCFLIDQRLFELVGEFDPIFNPAYHEDADMIYRIRLSRLKTVGVTTARYYHFGQGTLKAILEHGDQEELALEIRLAMNESMARYAEKWGGLPGNEIYAQPYENKK